MKREKRTKGELRALLTQMEIDWRRACWERDHLLRQIGLCLRAPPGQQERAGWTLAQWQEATSGSPRQSDPQAK